MTVDPHLRHCPECRQEWTVEDPNLILFHRCPGPPRRPAEDVVVGMKTREEIRSELWADLGRRTR